ncbi:MAG: hypothetical protein R3181_11515, partial [Rubricoccaceae bacterium]|nr:hypothetical protein [Rubricoccaceae bacterium]
MNVREWKAWLGELPWSLRWFVWLVLLRPLLDTLYFLKDISPFLSPLYIVGVLTPVAVVASFYAKSFPKANRSALDAMMGGWGWLLALSSLTMVVLFLSPGSLEIGLKIMVPVFLYFFCRHLIRSRRDLVGLLTTFLYSTAVPFLMLLYERLFSPLGALVYTRQYERYGGLYADVVSYAMYSVGAMLVVCYFFLAQPPYAKFRTHVFRLLVVSGLFVVALMSVHHAASYGVGGAIILLLIVHSVGSGRFTIPLVVLFVTTLGFLVVGDTIAERVEVMYKTDLAVISGEKEVDAAFHGRMSRWQVYLDYWGTMPAAAKMFGAPLSGASEGTLNSMLLGGIHSDYLRVMFASGVVGMLLYLLFYGGVLLRALVARWAERYLIVAAVAVVLMYSITIVPTLYAPLMYFCLPIFAYAALPRRVLREQPPRPRRVMHVPAQTPRVATRPAPLVPARAEGPTRPEAPEPAAPSAAPDPRPGPSPRPAPPRRRTSQGPPRHVAASERRRPAKQAAAAAAAASDALVAKALDEVVYRAVVDWITAEDVAAAVQACGAEAPEHVRAVALTVIGTALRQGLV